MRVPIIVALTSLCTFAQNATRFEVVSIKPAGSYEPGRPAGVHLDGALFSARGILLKNLIASSFQIPVDRVLGGPSWLDSEAYDITATLPQNTDRAELPPMLQALFNECFKLAVHHEMKQATVYALIVNKPTSRLRPPTGEKFSVQTSRGHLELHHASVPVLLTYLKTIRDIDHPVIDKTDLRELFDITLDWAPVSAPQNQNETGPSIFTAIQEAGFKLEPTKAALDYLVIDHLERPSDN